MPEQPRVKREQKPPLEKRPGRYEYSVRMPLYHLRLIGRIVIAWSKLEAVLQNMLWSFLKLGIEDGRVLSARMDTDRLINSLRKLAEHHIADDKTRKDFLDAMIRVENKKENRNLIVHGTWGMMGLPAEPLAGMLPIAMSLKPDAPDPSEVIAETFPQHRMYEIAHEIEAVTNFFIDFLIAHDPSLDKQKLGHLRP